MNDGRHNRSSMKFSPSGLIICLAKPLMVHVLEHEARCLTLLREYYSGEADRVEDLTQIPMRSMLKATIQLTFPYVF